MLLRAVRPAFGIYLVADRYQVYAHMGIGHTWEMIAPVDLASHVVFKVGSRSVKCIIVRAMSRRGGGAADRTI